MKLHSLLPAVVLSMAVLVQAQTKPAPQTPKTAAESGGSGPTQAKPAPQGAQTGVRKDLNANADGSVTLKAGLLGEVVTEIEQGIGDWPQKDGGEKPVMPNILYGTDTYNAEVPGGMRLRGVSPLQAVAFAAAAAGCTLEPIFGPKEAQDASTPKAIGYRIVRTSPFTHLQSSAGPMEQPLSELDQQINYLAATLGQNHPSVVAVRDHLKQLMSAETLVGVGIALEKKDGGTVVGQVVPGSPASFSPAIKPGRRVLRVAEEGKPDVDVAGFELEKVVQLIRGTPGSVVKITLGEDTDKGLGEHVFSLVRAKLQVKPVDAMFPKVAVVSPDSAAPSQTGLAGAGGGAVDGGSGDNQGVGVSFTQSAQGNVPSVRVYAMGSVLGGSDSEILEKENRFRQLVASAILMAGEKTGAPPDLNFHKQTRALIVKANAGQHEIIAQVIKALKENETQPAAPTKP